MRITNEHRPLFAWDRSVLVASGGRARLVPTVHEGAGVAWVVQDLQHAAEQQRTPDQLALAWPGLDVAREQQLVRLELRTVAEAEPVRRNVVNSSRTACWTC